MRQLLCDGATQSSAGSAYVADNNYAGGFGKGGYQINGSDGDKLIAGGGGGSGWIGGVTDGSTTAGQREGHGQAKISKV